MTAFQNNNSNTIFSCVVTTIVIGFIFFVTYPLNGVARFFGQYATSMFCNFFVLAAQAGGIVLFVLRLMLPAVYKYKLRYNFFAVSNLLLGLFGWIVNNLNPEPGDSTMLVVSILLGSVLLADIYLLKPKLPPASSFDKNRRVVGNINT
jgi:hypothetical protein